MAKHLIGYILIFILFINNIVRGQDNNLFSQFGLGELQEGNFAPNRGMGGVSAGFRSNEM